MNIKSLLIGSAATLVAVSGAQAADAIVVEPEPVEYVRVCDTYGTGFFFIPGTETCIRFSGHVRSIYEKAYVKAKLITTIEDNAGNTPTPLDITDDVFNTRNFDADIVYWGAGLSLNIDTRNETEWGTLRALMRLEIDSNTNSDVTMDVALISLAGFRAGFAGGNYWTTNHGFGGVNGEGAGQVIFATSDDAYGFYGFNDGMIFDYTFAAEGFSVTVGVEDPRIKYSTGDPANGTFNSNTGAYANFYAGFNYSGDWGAVAFTAVHDSLGRDVGSKGAVAAGETGFSSDFGEWAWKASINLDLSEFIPGGSIWGWYMNDGDAITNYVSGAGLLQNADTVWGVAFNADLTDEVEFWANYWNADGGNAVYQTTTGSRGIIEEGGAIQWGIGLNWYPSAAPGFHIKTSYYSGEIDDSLAASGFAVDKATYDAFSITLRRDF